MAESALTAHSQVELAQASLASLRQMRAELTAYETRVSYWRRLLQTRIDLLQEGSDMADRGRLARVLADVGQTSRRLVRLEVLPAEGFAPLPDLYELWQTVPDPDSRDDYVQSLRKAEAELSEHRQQLFALIDSIKDELICRYQRQPQLALQLLPSRDN